MNKILVVNVNWLGDAIFSLPVFKALKTAYPQSQVICLAVPRIKEILEMSPEVDRVIIYDEQGLHRFFWSKLKLVLQLRRERFDIVFLLHRSLTRALLVFGAGIPQRVGYDAKNRGSLLTHKVMPLAGVVHRMDFYLNVLESYGVKISDRRCALSVNARAADEIEHLLKKEKIQTDDFLVVVHPGGNWDLKRWPQANFAALIGRLISELNAKVVISGSDQDVALAQEIAAMSHSKPVVWAGKTPFPQLAALMHRASLVISADSGPLHLASSVGTPVLGLFGPTRPEVTGPRGRGEMAVLQKDVGCNREPCYYLECPDNVCMKSITVQEVFNEVQRIRN